MMAELDAINMYLQFAEALEDERFRKLFLDVAREEKTHLGEFLAALREVDEEQARELEEGYREAAELLGARVEGERSTENPSARALDPESLARELEKSSREALEKLRVFRKHIPVVRVPPGTLAVPVRQDLEELARLTEISDKIRLSKLALEASGLANTTLYAEEVWRAAREIARRENTLILDSLRERARVKTSRRSWDTPGEALEDVASALAELLRNGAVPPFILVLSPATYAKLVAVHEKTGVLEVERVRALVGEIVVSPEAGDYVILASANPAVLDLVVGADGDVEFLGPENGHYVYRLRETIALRVKSPECVAVLESKRG